MEMGGVRAESGAGILSCGLRVAGRALGQGPQRYLVQLRAQRRVSAGRLAHGLVGDQVGAGAARSVVLGYGDKELARCVEGGVCLPSGREHPLSEDQVDLPDSAFDPLTGTWWILCACELCFCSGQLAAAGFGRAPDGCGDHDWLALGNGLHRLPGPYGLTSRSSWPLRRAGTPAEGHWLHAKVHPGHFAR